MLSEFLALDGKITIIAFAAIVKVSVKMVWESERKKSGKRTEKMQRKRSVLLQKKFFFSHMITLLRAEAVFVLCQIHPL